VVSIAAIPDRACQDLARRTSHANNSAQMLPAMTIGSKSMSNCDGEWPADFSIPPNLGPAIDPILPMATAAPTPTPRMLVG
jgi:hypothetical protein